MSDARPKIMGVLIVAVLVLNLILGANAWKSNLKIKEIKIEGNRMVGTNELIQLTQVRPGTLLYKADLNAIQRNVTSHYYIKDAVVERNLPGSICVTVTERVPLVMINRLEPLYLDAEGVVLPRSGSRKPFDLPLMSGIPASESLTPGSILKHADIVEALQLLTAMKAMNRPLYNISEVQLRDGGDIVLYAAEGGVPIIFGRGNVANKLVRLETFWATVVRTRGPQDLQYVDLRFDDQIVARWNNAPTPGKPL